MALKNRSTIDTISKLTTKIIEGFKRKEKTAAIFFEIKKAYDKINRNKTFKLENMRLQEQMVKFIRTVSE